MKNKARIESLRKEKLLTEFNKKGISEKFVADFKINLTNPLGEYSARSLQAKVLKSLTRQVTKRLKEMRSYHELEKFINDISFGSAKIKIESLEHMENIEEKQHVIKLLANAIKKSSNEYSFDIYKGYLPISFEANFYDPITHRMVEESAYTFATNKLPKKYDRGKWKLRGSNVDYVTVRSLNNYCTKVFYVNVMEKFIVQNKHIFYYDISKRYVEESINEKNELIIPNEDIRQTIKEKIIQYDLLPNGVEFVESECARVILYDPFELENDISNGQITQFKEEYIEYMLPEFLEQTNSIMTKVDQELKAYSSYARAFETKKHINKETQESMENNHFLKKYGYVEIDNLVDLDKFSKLSEEFYNLNDQIYIPNAQDHSFRIKRLGKHRAAGIYFYGVKATIVDIDSPDSYIHELGHQIDYTCGKDSPLSETIAFRHILDEYKRIVREAVNKLPLDDAFFKKWTGGSNTNATYYLQPTEVFARCYELYIKNKGIETSFLKEHMRKEIYPQDDGLMKMVNEYFSRLFALVQPVSDIEYSRQDKVADVKVFNDDVETFTKTEQLSFF